MLLIPCPHCGPCAQTEFSYGGDTALAQAKAQFSAETANDGDSNQRWLDHIYLRDNPRGTHLEWWQHSSGCRTWFKVQRDTASHEIFGACQAHETIGAHPRHDDSGEAGG